MKHLINEKQITVNDKWIHYFNQCLQQTNSDLNIRALNICVNALNSYNLYLIEDEEE